MNRTRLPHADTTKGLMIIMIVFGHFIERLLDWNATPKMPLLSLMYLIHIPTFVFLSGCFFNPRHRQHKIKRLALLYALFQLLYTVCNRVTPPPHLISQSFLYDLIIFIARPNWIMWYLYSLMLWYALTPLLQKCRFSLALSCAAALAAGWATWDTYWFSLGRTLCFLPFFLLGQQHGTALLHRLRHTCPAWQHLACIALITALLAYCCVAGALNISFVYGSFNFWQQHLDPIHGTLLRVFVMLLSALGVLAALQSAVLLSGRRGASILAALGRRTLPVYLLHGFAVLAVQPFYPWRHDFAATCLFAALASVLTAWACSRNRVQKVFDGIIFGKQTN